MANTTRGIYYPDNYDVMANVPEDMKKMADSVEAAMDTEADSSDTKFKEIENEIATQNTQIVELQTSVSTNTKSINNLNEKDSTLETNITQNTQLIKELQKENALLKSQIPTGRESGESITVNDSSNLAVEKFVVSGNSKQDGTPSIETPIQIQAVESANIVVCNKNYLDSSIFADIEQDGVNIKRNVDGTITLNGTYTGNTTWNYIFRMVNILPAEIAKNCIISMKKVSGSVIGELRFMLWDPESGNRWVNFENTNYEALLEKEYRRASLMVYPGAIFDSLTIALQVEEGQKTDYLQHEHQNFAITTQQEMLESNDFVKIDGVWKERYIWKKLILNGTESWVLSSSSTDEYYAFQLNATSALDNDTSVDKIYCEQLQFDGMQGTETKNYENIAINKSAKNLLRIWIKASRLNDKTVTALKEFLATNNIVIYYKLAEPIFLACTADQIKQLEALQKARTYKNVTHFYSTDTIKPVMDVTYSKDLEILFNNVSQAILLNQ